MANKYLGREDAPFGEKIWGLLDDTVVGVARSQLCGRRLLDIEGPYGLALKSVPLNDSVAAQNGAKLISSDVLPIPLIEAEFELSARDLAAYEENGFALDTEGAVMATLAVAAMEDSLIFEGNKALGIAGLMTAKGTQSLKLRAWDDIGTAAEDIIKGVTQLDQEGFHGPYLLALAPALYNRLYRLYPQGNQTEMGHIESVVGGKVVKAPCLNVGGVLLASGKRFASIIVGQDLTAGYVGPDDGNFEFTVTESLAPRIRVPASICVLKG